MTKIDTLFLSKTAKTREPMAPAKSHTLKLRAVHTYVSHIREYAPPVGNELANSLLTFYLIGIRVVSCQIPRKDNFYCRDELTPNWLIIPQGSVRVSAVPIGLGTTDTQPAHMSLWQLFPTDLYRWCVSSSGWIKRTRNWFYTRSLSLSKHHQPSRGRNFFSVWLSHNSVL